MPVIIKEKLDTRDFLEANFPHVYAPIYKKRYFIINMAFGILFALATLYLYFLTFKNHIKFEATHYIYLLFSVLFIFLAFYLVKREKKLYGKAVDQINDLNTVYTIDKHQIKVDNKQVNLRYKTSDIKRIIEWPKWFVIEFNNNERINLYKPNMTPLQTEEFLSLLGNYVA